MNKSHFSCILEAINDESVQKERSNEEKARRKLKSYAGWVGAGAVTGAAKGAFGGYAYDKMRRVVGGEINKDLLNREKNLTGNRFSKAVSKYGLKEVRREVSKALPPTINKKRIGRGALIGAAIGGAISVPQRYAWDKFRKNRKVRGYYKGKMEQYFGED